MNFSFKPVLIGWVTLLCQVPLQIFLTIWSGGFFGGMSMAAGLFPKNSHDPFIIFGSLAFIACPLILYFGKKWNYDQTECRFFEDRIEFEEGFFTINKKVIKYRDIKETTLRKGVFQRLYGLGTIYLGAMTTGSSRANVFGAMGFGNVSASGVGLCDVADPDVAYEKIK